MEHPPAEGRKHRQDLLKGVAFASGEDGNVAGRGPMTTTRHWTVDRFGTDGEHLFTQPFHLGLIGGAHLEPDLARTKARNDAVVCFEDGRARRRGWKTGDDDVARFSHLLGRVCPGGTTIEKWLHGVLIEITDHQVVTVAKHRSGQLAANVSKTDEPNFHSSSLPRDL